jgi:hypothetical protein
MATAQLTAPEQETRTEGELSISLSEMLGLLGCLEEPEDSETGAKFSADVHKNVQRAISDKLRRYQNFFSFCDAQTAECASEIKRMQARKKAIEGAKERLRKYLARAMDMHGIGSLNAGTVVFSLYPGAKRLNILNDAAIPFDYKSEEIVVTVDQARLKRALEALQPGERIEGAELVTGESFVVTR